MHELIDFNSKKKWLEVIKSFRLSDIYFQWGYIKTFEIHGDGRPLLFYYEDENGKVANIFFLRDIGDSDIFKDKISRESYFDISSVYGYGGLLYEGTDLKALGTNYADNFNQYCFQNNIISEFIRFNPLLENHKILINLYDLIPIRKTVYMDLSKGEEYIWNSLKSENRTRIRKAMKGGIEIIKGRDPELLDCFIELYYKTMDRDKAVPYYYFKKDFFSTTIEELPENSIVFAAKYGERIISACLVLFNDKYIHYHLGGSDTEYMNLAPNNLLFFEVAKWAIERKINKFHLGGGYSGSNDSLFRFKKSFSKSEPLDFYIGKKVHNEQVYNYLNTIRKENDIMFNVNNGYFPAYRE